MKLVLALSCIFVVVKDGVNSQQPRCHQRRLTRCATALARFSIPMIESRNHSDFEDPHNTARRFCRKVHPKLNCVYNRLPECEGEMDTQGVEERAGILSYVCGEGRKDLIQGSQCWSDHRVSHRLQHCRERYNISDIVSNSQGNNADDNTEVCSTIDEYVWNCVGDWLMDRCDNNLALFLIRVVNPETLQLQLGC